MKIHERYLMREVGAATFLVLFAFIALFSFFDLIHELKDVNRGGYELRHAIAYVALRMPGRGYELTPISILIGTLFALTTLARNSEISVMRVSGLSTASLLSTLFKISGIFALLTFFFGEVVVPYSERAAQQFRIQATQSVVAQEFRTGLWVKDGASFVNIKTVSPDIRLHGIRIFEFDERLALTRVSEAAEGQYVPPDTWRLLDVTDTYLDPGGARARVERQAETRWRSVLSPDILSVLLIVPERMSLPHLITYIHHLVDNRQKAQRYEIAVWKKIVYPLATLVMVALALPFGYTHNRVAGVSLKIFAGVMVGVLFHMLNGLFSSLGAINSWPPFASAVAPSVLFLAAAAFLIWWVERR